MKKQGLESRLQFSVSGALKLTLVAAVVLAAVVPWLRQYDEAQQHSVILLWASAGACWCLGILPLLYCRYRIERSGGAVQFVLPIQDGAEIDRLRKRGGAVQFVLPIQIRRNAFAVTTWFWVEAVVQLVVGTAITLLLGPETLGWWWPLVIGTFIGFNTVFPVSMLYGGGGQLELRANGVAYLYGFVPWENVLSATVDHDAGRLLIVRSGFLGMPMKAIVAKPIRQDVEKFLASVRPNFKLAQQNITAGRTK